METVSSGFGGSTDSTFPLHKAAREGRYEDLKELLKSQGSDINKGTFDLVRPLHEACLAGHYSCAALLLEHGADVNLANYDGATALCDACSRGSVEIVKLLLDSGADVNPPLLMTTPVHEAVFRGHSECLTLLLKQGACLNKSDCHYGTPLHAAACRGQTKCAEILLRFGADPTLSQIYNTPLHEAARSQNLCLVELLLEHGADAYACNGKGLTAKLLVPSSTSPCKMVLQDWETMPKSLKHYCRKTIRSALTANRLKYVSSLGLPRYLTNFVAFTDENEGISKQTV